MTFPATAGSDPDPTTQIAWPRSRSGDDESDQNSSLSRTRDPAGTSRSPNHDPKATDPDKSEEIGKRRLSTLNLFNLSLGMAGSQIVWTVELGWGTPFLLRLGLSEQYTSLVWLAGPISGLIAQPLIGAISDSSTSRYRRRFWIITSTAVLVVSTLVLAYCETLAAFLVDLFGGGLGDWDPKRKSEAANTAIWLAVFCFYLLDFALNALQASLRNLLLDVTPPVQLNSGNAWHGRMLHAGNIVGYGVGFVPLASFPIIRSFGGDQFTKFCMFSLLVLSITVAVTCFSQDEKEGKKEDFKRSKSPFRDVLRSISDAIVNLPRPIRRVCYVQIFAYMGWFPFLFYATTYVGQVMARELNAEPDHELATRRGEVALLIYSVVAAVAGTVLPQLAKRDSRLLADVEDDEDEELVRLRATVREWRSEAARRGKPMKLPRMPFMLRNIWTAGMLLFFVFSVSTFFISTVTQATIAISLVGVCWAIACWVPFAIIMEFLKEMNEAAAKRDTNDSAIHANADDRHLHTRTQSTPLFRPRRGPPANERQPLIRRRSASEQRELADDLSKAQPVAGGTVLGIHNLAIVIPQFIIAIVASGIFKAVDEGEGYDPQNTYLGRNGVAWVMRFGGICALMGVVAARRVPPTKAERAMRRRLAEMKYVKDQETP